MSQIVTSMDIYRYGKWRPTENEILR